MSKTPWLLLCMLLLSATGQPALANDASFEQRMFETSRIPRAINRQRSGRILTFMAIAHIALGAGLLTWFGVETAGCSSRPGCRYEGFPIEVLTGSLLLSSGLMFAASGIPLWVVGSQERKRSISVSAGSIGATF